MKIKFPKINKLIKKSKLIKNTATKNSQLEDIVTKLINCCDE